MNPAEKRLMSLLQDTCRLVFTVLLVLIIELLISPNEGSVLRAALRSELTHWLHLKFGGYFS